MSEWGDRNSDGYTSRLDEPKRATLPYPGKYRIRLKCGCWVTCDYSVMLREVRAGRKRDVDARCSKCEGKKDD